MRREPLISFYYRIISYNCIATEILENLIFLTSINFYTRYNLLGTSYILKRMKDAVEARKKTKGGRMGFGLVNHAENMLRGRFLEDLV